MVSVSSDILFKVFLAFTTLLVTLIAGWQPFKKHVCGGSDEFAKWESLACGVFLGAGLLHLLGEAEEHFNALSIHYPLAAFIAALTFLLFLYLEHLGRELYQQTGKRTFFVWLAVGMFSVHSLLEGAALGVSLELSVVMILFVAIIGHKWADSFAVAIYLRKSPLSEWTKKVSFWFFALMTPLGILFGSFLSAHIIQNHIIESICTSMAAGTFLYLGTLHGLEQGVMVKQCCNLKNYRYVILGFLIMAVIAIFD